MASVKCPRCNSHTTNEPYVVRTTANPVNRNYSPLDVYCPITTGTVSIVKCGACEQYFVVDVDRPVWPLTSPPAPESVPEKIKEAYEHARLAHAAGANIAALMAARTVLIRFQRDKDAKDFKELVERQIITPAIYGAVDQLRLWAAVAGHDDIEVNEFDAQEVEDILDYLATALEVAYTHQARVDKFVNRTKQLRGQ